MDVLNKAHEQGLVVGLRDAAGIVPRLDIDELLLKYPATFNLLVLALKELKGEDDVSWPVPSEFRVAKGDKFSFFQIAGIHGLPMTEWDHEKAPGKTPGGRTPGYCTHGTPIFGPWHRPYLAMLEQTLFRHIANVAQRFAQSSKLTASEKQEYVDAVKQFRLPYWDYYRPRDYQTTFPGVSNGKTTTAPFDYHLPQIFTLPEIMVKTLPDNELKAVANPFWQYKFAAGDLTASDWNLSGIDLSVAAVRDHTLRYGGNDNTAVSALNNNLNKIREDEMRASLSMIEAGSYSNFRAFSTAGVLIKGGDPDDTTKILQDNTGSIEGLHDNYHVYVGGFSGNDSNTGHMSCVPIAAFDPVFWIHHCQIDRLFAIWQAVNPTHWFNELPAAQRGLADDILLPFRKYPLTTDKKARYWTSNSSRDPQVFGYTYPDISDATKSAEQLREDFAGKYGWSRRLTPFQHFGSPPPDMQPLDLSKAQVYQYTSGVPSARRFRPLSVVSEAKKLPLKTQVLATGTTQAVPFTASVAKKTAHPDDDTDGGMVSTRDVGAPAAQQPRVAKVSQEWYIDAVVERLALNGSFTIFYIIGEVHGNSGSEWSALPGLVGVTHVFTSPNEVCDNCGQQEQQARLVTSTSPITSLLLDYVEIGRLASMEAGDVQPFLIKNLKWRIQTAKGEIINPRNLFHEHSLRLSISCKTAPLPGESGEVQYSFYPGVIEAIIAQSS